METPRSTPGVAELIVWANASFDKISEITNEAYLSVKSKKNMRSLSKVEAKELEELKIHVLSNLQPMSEVNVDSVRKVIGSTRKMPEKLKNQLDTLNINLENMNMENFRRHAISCYVECFLGS